MKLISLIAVLVLFISSVSSQDSECGFPNRQTPLRFNDNEPNLVQQKIIIPVVFHVVYENEREKVGREKVEAELTQLQINYLGQNPDLAQIPGAFRSRYKNPQIEFRLATQK